MAAATALAAVAATPSPADAHLMPAHEATLAVRDRRVFLAMSLPAASFAAADDDADGRLSPVEVTRHGELLQRLVATRVHLRDAHGEGRLLFARVSVERQDPDAPLVAASDVLVLVVAAFDAAPTTLTLAVDGLAAGDHGRLRVRAAHGERTEVARLDGDHATYTFFTSPWRHFADGALQGAQHIVGGADHLAFLLTLVLAGAGWAYWGSVVSSFTAAHALVLVLAATGHAPPVPPAVTEVCIAATIVLMAVRVATRGRESRPRVGREAALAALCGLVHGMGIAGAMRALDADGAPDLVALAGFNLGVEGAQLAAVLLFVAASAGATVVLSRAAHAARAMALAPRLLAGAVGMAGMGWMAVRVPALW